MAKPEDEFDAASVEQSPPPLLLEPAASAPLDSAAPAPPALEPDPAPAPPTDATDAFLRSLEARVARARVGLVDIRLLNRSPDGRGGDLLIIANDPDTPRRAASALLNSEDNREWRFIGAGPDGEDTGRYHAHVRVHPIP